MDQKNKPWHGRVAPRGRPGHGILLAVLVALALTGATGCSCSEDAPPRGRVGGMPFPGLFTLYGTVGVDELGRHRYRNCIRLFQQDEKERGTMYTTRAGFLDLAHIRVAIDRTRYCVREVRRGIESNQNKLTLSGPNFSIFHVTLDYPPDWASLSPGDRAQVVDELSLRTGQQVAYLMLVWHEVITWFGYRTFLFDEAPSAFSYEDTMSHFVGLRVAERALRDTSRSFDDAVTAALPAELTALGIVTRRQTDQAARSVKGIWWANERPLKRHLDFGIWDDAVYPWLISDLPFASCVDPEPFCLPRLDDICGRDMTGFYSIEIQPNILQARRMRKHLPGRPARISDHTDLPILLKVVRAQMEERFGAEVNEPWPDAPKTADEVATASPKQ